MAEENEKILIVDLFKRRAAEVPQEIALRFENDESLSYTALDSVAQSIGSCVLEQLGSSASSTSDTPLVCIMLERHAALIASMLGVLMAGAAYVPVDPAFPADRQAYIFEHSQCKLLIADESCYASALSFGISLPPVIVVSPKGDITKSPKGVTVPKDSKKLEAVRQICYQRHNGGLMYVLYTSGSTGKPKGVMVSQFGVTNIVSWFVRELGVRQGHRVLGLTTACFDISVLEIYLPLISGATLVLADSASQKDPFRLLEVMRQFGVTVFQATPTTYEMMLATGWRGDRSVDFLVGGEAFRPSLFPLLGACRSLRNVYGPTETTIWSSSYTLPNTIGAIPVSTTSSSTVVSVPVGKPISQTTFYLVDVDSIESNKFILSRTEGELCIGGAGVAAGYLHAPDLTAARFIPNPFGEGTIYRTGDLVKMLGSGDYLFVRRLDDQVKIGGFRIELAEIETVYQKHALVEQAVAVVRDNRLVLYIKIRDNRDLSSSEKEAIHEAASRSLTYYMIPKATVIVKAFPQTANGKLDKNALPAYTLEADDDDALRHDGEEDAAATSAAGGHGLDKSMADHTCDIIQGIKGRRPRPSSYFTSLGVDSLGAVLFIRNLSDSLGGHRIEPAKIYAANVTIASFAEELYKEIAKSRPDILLLLKITREPGAEGALEGGYGSGKTAVRGQAEDVEADFENGIMGNRRLYEGLRGVFTFMVLWDHYHPPHLFFADSWAADTSLFVILSGFTTAVQLREAPQRSEKKAGNSLRPRSPFDWRFYFTGRAVGIFPILWVALIICSPRFSEGDKNIVENLKLYSYNDANTCYFLYTIGMQSWVRPQCKALGPNDTLYASIIWNVFLIYGVLRLAFIPLQNIYMRWSTVYAGESSSGSGKKDWKTKFGDIVTMVAYSRPCPSIAIAYAVFWLVLMSVALLLLWAFCGMKNGLTYISYFVAGVSTEAVLESIHWALWNRHISLEKWTSADLFPSTRTLAPPELQDNDPVVGTSWITLKQPSSVRGVLWRFLPDAIAVFCGLVMSTDGYGTYDEARLITWIGLSYIIIAYIVVVSLQRGSDRLNLSRYFLESSPMNLLGYISYPMYLLQHVAFDYYAALYDDDIRINGFNSCELWKRFVGVIILIGICWAIQKYIQDTFVAKLYGYFASYRLKKAKLTV